MNEKIVKAVGEIVSEVTANRQPILTSLSQPEGKDTVEITINKKASVFVHCRGIKITASNNENNIGLGLSVLKSDNTRCKLDLGFDEAKRAGEILSKLK